VPRHDLEEHAAAYGEAVARLHNACDDFASDQPRFALNLVHLLDRPLAAFEPFLRDRPDDDRYLRALVALLRGRVEAAASDLHIWWMGLHAGSADHWGSRRWVNDRFFDDHIRGSSSGATSTCRVRRGGYASGRSSGTADRPLPLDTERAGCKA
jgi:hypothetical protein